ncbi:GAF domain-containing protein [Pedobacter sp. CCM 8938]|uniref:GAF domain-containing protein n=2 Tax=Pedobacter fastidiosus TaxID=2765361 RepID=A0ABR7KY34_9SPHI|nr:GAF domain-containing protein [Pedobacter fastidiosus]MBC6112583.1 GAF domain-containing protein [Pedobacter fastidiosus]
MSSEKIDNEEILRLQTLKSYDILDTPKDGAFDRLTRIASQFLNVPIAIISLVDEDRIWFKSIYGANITEIERAPGLCASAILVDGFYTVEHASVDPRTLTNPLIASEMGLEFYAAFPLKTSTGYNLGTFCILDKQPRHLEFFEIAFLKDLRDIVMDFMELKLQARTLVNSFEIEIN